MHDVGKTGNRAEALEDRRLFGPAKSVGEWMPEECSRHCARAQMLENAALNCLCWLGDFARKIEFLRSQSFRLRPSIASAGPLRLRHAPATSASGDCCRR